MIVGKSGKRISWFSPAFLKAAGGRSRAPPVAEEARRKPSEQGSCRKPPWRRRATTIGNCGSRAPPVAEEARRKPSEQGSCRKPPWRRRATTIGNCMWGAGSPPRGTPDESQGLALAFHHAGHLQGGGAAGCGIPQLESAGQEDGRFRGIEAVIRGKGCHFHYIFQQHVAFQGA